MAAANALGELARNVPYPTVESLRQCAGRATLAAEGKSDGSGEEVAGAGSSDGADVALLELAK